MHVDVGGSRLGIDATSNHDDEGDERGDPDPVRHAPRTDCRDHAHRRYTDEKPECPRGLRQPDDAAPLFILHVVGNPGAEPEVETLLREREDGDADAEDDKVR